MEKDVNSLDKINVVGDRVLVKPRKESERSESGLYLPPGVKEKEKNSVWIYCEIWSWLSNTSSYG